MKTIEIAGGFHVPESDNFCGKWAREAGRLDHDQRFFEKVEKHIPLGGYVVDAGAYIGDQTIFYSNRVGPDGFVLAIEPVRDFRDILAHNVSIFPHKNVRICPFALGSSSSWSEVVPDRENPGQTFLQIGHGKTAVVTLDYILAQKASQRHDKVDFIKLDVEGFEFHALIGAERTIRSDRPVIVVEMNPFSCQRMGITYEAIYAVLSMYRYECVQIEDEEIARDGVFNLLCLPKLD